MSHAATLVRRLPRWPARLAVAGVPVGRRGLHGLASAAAILGAWWGASAAGLVSPFLLPPPAQVLRVGLAMAADGSLAAHALVSCGRAAAGFLIAAGSGILLAGLFTVLPTLRWLLGPPLEFLRQIPPLALLPLLILWLGIGEAQKLGIVALVCFFPVFLGTLDGFAGADPRLVEVGRSMGLSRWALMRRVVLPAAAGAIVTGLRIALGLSWRAVVGAELIAASAGLGYMIVDAQNLARTDIVMVGVAVIGTMGVAVDLLARWMLRRAVPWLRQDAGLGGA